MPGEIGDPPPLFGAPKRSPLLRVSRSLAHFVREKRPGPYENPACLHTELEYVGVYFVEDYFLEKKARESYAVSVLRGRGEMTIFLFSTLPHLFAHLNHLGR